MKFFTTFGAALVLTQGLASAGLARRQDFDRGSETVSGLGARKQEITSAGGTTQDLGIAMLETKDLTTNYAYGDNKDKDAANFGIFKQNWLMLRTAVPDFQGQTPADFDNGAVLNDDLSADIAARHTSMDYFGEGTWFSGHRNGESGLKNPNTDDIATYRSGVEWIIQQLESDEKYLTDDTRFWADVTAI